MPRLAFINNLVSCVMICKNYLHSLLVLVFLGSLLEQTASTLTTTMGASSSREIHPAPPEEEEEKHTHLMVLVHGWIGNDKDLAYFHDTIEKQAAGSGVVFHIAKCNVGSTHDGIEPGGERLAMEINQQIAEIKGPVRLSIVAHSLGGLYSRYAISKLNMESVQPWIFCTFSTPHLGVCNHTYIPIPRWAETSIGNMMKETGRDLFCVTDIVKELGTVNTYLDPLSKFKKRIAMATAFATDFQVPPATAAFLSRDSEYAHKTLPQKDVYLLSVETEAARDHNKECMSQRLDSLGWTKVFLDVRDQISLPSIPLPWKNKNLEVPEKDEWASKDLIPVMGRPSGKWHLPIGHSVSIANSRDDFYVWLNSKGKKFMDQLAHDMLHLMGIEPVVVVEHPQPMSSEQDSASPPVMEQGVQEVQVNA